MQDRGEIAASHHDVTAQNDESRSGPPASGSKRKRYTAKACNECKKRKIRCSGDSPCTTCTNSHSICEYSCETAQSLRDGSSNAEGRSAAHDADEAWKVELLSRIKQLSDEVYLLKASCSSLKPPSISAPQSSEPAPLLTSATCGESSSHHVLPDQTSLDGVPNLLEPLKTLSETAHKSAETSHYSSQRAQCSLGLFDDPTRCFLNELRTWATLCQHDGSKSIKEVAETYFACVNPHYPCLEASLFYESLENKIASLPGEATIDNMQFIALTYLMSAVVKILDDFCSDNNVTPGWSEFTRAEHLLNHIIRGHKGNLVTLQCLILKSSYLLYVERPDWAYDEIGSAIRLCFQLGLHNQKCWKNLSPLDVEMRQRIFWCTFCLDRNMSHLCGAPYHIRERDICVNLPPVRSPGSESFGSEAEPGSHSLPYLLATIKWAKICSDLWDSILGVNAQPITSEFIAITDARIALLVSELPQYLKWSPDMLDDANFLQYPRFILRQSVILHLRTNHIKLLLRQHDLLRSSTSTQWAATCVDTASSSVEVVQRYHRSARRGNTERYATTTYLTGAIIALSGVILAGNVDVSQKRKAANSLDKGVQILEDVAPGYTLARSMLERLHRVIIASRVAASNFNEPTTAPTDRGSSSQQMQPPLRNNVAVESEHNFDQEFLEPELEGLFPIERPVAFEEQPGMYRFAEPGSNIGPSVSYSVG